ncbi:MAG: NusG domain II-containing protein [Tissierellia bacterium]|nr:NusG domain II-containing protein [Tissierellia bacterium]
MKTTRGDKVLVVLLSIFSLFIAIYFANLGTKYSEKYVSVQVNGEEIKKIQFSYEMIGKTYEIKTEFGRNVIELGEDSVRVIEADCPDQLDVKQGAISRPGQLLVCLPNRLIVEIKAENEKNEENQPTIDSYNY